MQNRKEVNGHEVRPVGAEARARLLKGIPVNERQLNAAGISTAVLEGGEGPPVVLLHGPGEFGAKWLRVIPELVGSHRVIAPDLPAHGASEVLETGVDAELACDWLGELIELTCPSPPVLVGHVLGGAIAARFAIRRSDRLDHLVLVDSLGLAPFRPSPRFALAMIRMQVRPTERAYYRFMRQCSLDLESLRDEMGAQWDPFVAYTIELARGPGAKIVRRMMRDFGIVKISPDDLARIDVPATLIWGRGDRALHLPLAEAAGARYGWPLHVIENCADDPARDQPEAFLRALRAAIGRDLGPGRPAGRLGKPRLQEEV